MENQIKVNYEEVYKRGELLRWFQSVMMSKLLENAHKGSEGLNDVGYLLKRLDDEVEELKEAIIKGSHKDIIRETGDVGNFAMFIAAFYKKK